MFNLHLLFRLWISSNTTRPRNPGASQSESNVFIKNSRKFHEIQAGFSMDRRIANVRWIWGLDDPWKSTDFVDAECWYSQWFWELSRIPKGMDIMVYLCLKCGQVLKFFGKELMKCWQITLHFCLNLWLWTSKFGDVCWGRKVLSHQCRTSWVFKPWTKALLLVKNRGFKYVGWCPKA